MTFQTEHVAHQANLLYYLPPNWDGFEFWDDWYKGKQRDGVALFLFIINSMPLNYKISYQSNYFKGAYKSHWTATTTAINHFNYNLKYKLTSSLFLFSSFNVWLGIKITLYNSAHVHVTKILFFFLLQPTALQKYLLPHKLSHYNYSYLHLIYDCTVPLPSWMRIFERIFACSKWNYFQIQER